MVYNRNDDENASNVYNPEVRVRQGRDGQPQKGKLSGGDPRTGAGSDKKRDSPRLSLFSRIKSGFRGG
ncbi:hypothetical protein GCM10009414_32510 [Tatumella terrea]